MKVSYRETLETSTGVHLPSTRQVSTAGGLDSLVSQVRETMEPSVTSRGPDTLTEEGASAGGRKVEHEGGVTKDCREMRLLRKLC